MQQQLKQQPLLPFRLEELEVDELALELVHWSVPRVVCQRLIMFTEWIFRCDHAPAGGAAVREDFGLAILPSMAGVMKRDVYENANGVRCVTIQRRFTRSILIKAGA